MTSSDEASMTSGYARYLAAKTTVVLIASAVLDLVDVPAILPRVGQAGEGDDRGRG